MTTTEKTLDDGTVVRLRDVTPLPPYVRYLILHHLYSGVRKSRLSALTAAWRGTTFFTWIDLSAVPSEKSTISSET